MPDRALSASPPPIDGVGAGNEKGRGSSLAPHQNGHEEPNEREEAKTPVVSPNTGLAEHSLPELPSTEQGPDTKI